jgi:hypothetical protein
VAIKNKKVKMSFKKNSLIVLIVLMHLCMQAQPAAKGDTAAMIKNYNKVMAFAVQPYLYYSSTTKMSATPIMQPEDTMTIKAEYYKNETNLYSSNAKEIIYMEDSFYIEINHDRKSIWISKVDVESKKKMNLLPLDRKEMQDLFRKSYTISEKKVDKTSTQLNFESVQSEDSISFITTKIAIQYETNSYLPQSFIMGVQAKQQVSEENIEMLKQQGTDIKELVKTIDSVRYMIRSQKMTMTFDRIDYSKEKVIQMPSWKTIFAYDVVKNEFIVLDKKYKEYELVKTY